REPPDAGVLPDARSLSARGDPRTVSPAPATEPALELLPGDPGFRLLLPADPAGGMALDGRDRGRRARRRGGRLRTAARFAGGAGMSSAAPAIVVREATKVYRRYGPRPHGTLKSALLFARRAPPREGVVALDGVSFELPAGGTLGVIGANGSGKSTLLKLLSGILRPTRGSVEVRGRLAALLELGAGFHPEISGRENVEITGLLLGLTKREIVRRFDEIVAFAGVEDFLDAPVKTYSSGMAVRLGFAIAAHVDPDVLLVDEVLAVGDEAFSHRALEKFSEFERQGRTLVFVSHDLQLIAERCRRVVYLERGRLVADGPAEEVVARYRERVAAAEGVRRLEAGGSGSRVGSGAAAIES